MKLKISLKKVLFFNVFLMLSSTWVYADVYLEVPSQTADVYNSTDGPSSVDINLYSSPSITSTAAAFGGYVGNWGYEIGSGSATGALRYDFVVSSEVEKYATVSIETFIELVYYSQLTWIYGVELSGSVELFNNGTGFETLDSLYYYNSVKSDDGEDTSMTYSYSSFKDSIVKINTNTIYTIMMSANVSVSNGYGKVLTDPYITIVGDSSVYELILSPGVNNVDINPVPIPDSMIIFGVGLTCLAALSRKKVGKYQKNI